MAISWKVRTRHEDLASCCSIETYGLLSDVEWVSIESIFSNHKDVSTDEIDRILDHVVSQLMRCLACGSEA